MDTEGHEAEWTVENLTAGWLVTEGCGRCGARRSFFSQEQTAPVDIYIEGNHCWKDFEGSRAVRFDLACSSTGTVVKLDNFLGLALCMDCNPSCLVGTLSKLLRPNNVRIYLALCADPSHVSSKCASSEQTTALTNCFNSRLRGTSKRVLIMPCIFRKEPDCCRGQVIDELSSMEVH